MKLGQYTKPLNSLANAQRRLLCAYCGTSTAALGNAGICSNCESIAYYESESLPNRDPVLAGSLKNIRDAIANANYEDAIAEYEKLCLYSKDPSFLYAEALVYIKYSNRENSKISYDRPGFMEDNADLTERSLNLAVKAKALLAKAIAIAREDVAKGNNSPNILYALLLAQLKFGELRGARKSLDTIERYDKSTLYNYAAMLLEAHIGNYRKVMEYADAIINSNDVISNAFFYAGLAMFKLGRRTDAEKLLRSASKVSDSSSIPALIEEIRRAELIWV